MKNLSQILLVTAMLSPLAANAGDFQFLKSATPITQKDTEKLYLFAGDSSKKMYNDQKCWMLFQVNEQTQGHPELVGVADMTFNSLSVGDEKASDLVVTQSNGTSLEVTVRSLTRKIDYKIGLDNSNTISSYQLMSHDNDLAVLSGDAMEDVSLNCSNLKIVSDQGTIMNQLWGGQFVLENIDLFNKNSAVQK